MVSTKLVRLKITPTMCSDHPGWLRQRSAPSFRTLERDDKPMSSPGTLLYDCRSARAWRNGIALAPLGMEPMLPAQPRLVQWVFGLEELPDISEIGWATETCILKRD